MESKPAAKNDNSSDGDSQQQATESPQKDVHLGVNINTPTVPLVTKQIPSDYVFGSNISSRVVNADISQGASLNLWNSASDVADSTLSSTSVFTALAKAFTKSKNVESHKNLEDSAREVIEDKRREALSLAEVDVITGEEGERQVVRQHCRAYVFDTNTQKWSNLGGSYFHLNDIPSANEQQFHDLTSRSRVVVRLMSTRRVIINTLVWAEMPVALVDARSLRIGAVNEDGDHIRSYLFTFPPDEYATRIYDALIARKKKAASAIPTSKASSIEVKTSIAGQKRRIENDSECAEETADVSSKVVHTVHIPTTESTSITTLFPKSNIFRPSLLSPVNAVSSFSLDPSSRTRSTNNGGTDICFRQSPLDAVVKRLHSSTTTELSTQISQSAELNGEPVTNSANTSERAITPTCNSDVDDHSAVSSNEENGERSDCVIDENDVPLPTEKVLSKSAALVAAEFHEISRSGLGYFPEAPTVIEGKKEHLMLKLACRFYCFDLKKQEWFDRGQVHIHLNDVFMNDPPSDVANPPLTYSPSSSSIIVYSRQTLKVLTIIPIRPSLNVKLIDESSFCITAVHNSTEHFDQSPLHFHSELLAYLLVLRSHKETDCLVQALLSRIAALKNYQLFQPCENITDSGGRSDGAQFSNVTCKASQPKADAVHMDNVNAEHTSSVDV